MLSHMQTACRIADGWFKSKPEDSLADGLAHIVVGLELGDAIAVTGDLREHGLDDGAEEVLEVLPAGAPAQAGRCEQVRGREQQGGTSLPAGNPVGMGSGNK